ncbi:MAG: hypothetical protein QWI36_03375 [Wolbachia endosymbiont of Tyrophagus putrescentiae]|nr:hypothetical protein [Wolbachia endosymbiont of Tyrophagus putrescentiae]
MVKDGLIYRKRVRTYSKRLVTILSIVLGLGYIILDVMNFNLCFAVAGIILSAISFGLNLWSLNDHKKKQELNKEFAIKENKLDIRNKSVKISLDMLSSSAFFMGGVLSALMTIFILPIDHSIPATCFTIGYLVITLNIVMGLGKWLGSTKLDDTKVETTSGKDHLLEKESVTVW